MSPTGRRGLPEDREPHPRSGVPISEILAALPRTGPEGVERVCLEPVVAAALRTAVDFLAGDARVRRPLLLSHDEAVLEARFEGVDLAGAAPASELLEPVGANLGPVLGGGVSWLIRVPVLAPRGTYLMLQQGMLPLAVPWHSVLQVRMVPAAAMAALPRQQGYPVLSPLARGPHEGAERPLVLVGLGLKRAFVVADRLVWRLPAETIERSDPAGRAGLSRTVRTAEGEVFWVAEPAFLLRDVEPPSPLELGRELGPGGTHAAEAYPAGVPRPGAAPSLIELGPQHVEPLHGGPAGFTTPSVAISPAPVAAPRRALVAEDSLTARIFLWRLLEQRGFEVRTVTTAAELEAARGAGPWTLVCADVELPDSHRGRHLADWAAPSAGGSALVALVRDAEDERWASSAGARHLLRKPFEAEALERLLRALELAR